MKKILLVLFLAALFTGAASATVNTIGQGDDVFIGEQDLNITSATGGFSQLAWFASGTNPNADTPNYIIPVGDPAHFYIAPSTFVGRTGNWYRWDITNQGPAFSVNDPNIALKVWNQDSSKDISGRLVAAGDMVNFRIESNLYPISNRVGYDPATDGPVDIRVKTSLGVVYTSLYQNTTLSIPLNAINLNSQPFYWVSTAPLDGTDTPYAGWNTGTVDGSGARVYPAGVYTCWAETRVNHMRENYKDPSGHDYTGKTVSATTTVTIASDTVVIEPSKDTVIRGNPFSVTVSGRPNSYYYLWVKNTGGMSGLPGDEPPVIVPNQNNVNQNPPAGSYTAVDIGSYQFQGGNGTTIASDVPPEWNGAASGAWYYALILTSDSGTRTIGWQTSRDTKEAEYIFRVEREAGPGVYMSDETDVAVERGAVTLGASGRSYAPGEPIEFLGTNTATDFTYLFVTGPGIPEQGGMLIAPQVPVGNGNLSSFIVAGVLEDHTWRYRWSDGTENLTPGTYTVYAVAFPRDRDHLDDVEYGTGTVLIHQPGEVVVTIPAYVSPGWNFFSTPIALDPAYSNLTSIFPEESLAHISVILAWDGTGWSIPGPDYRLEPLYCLVVKSDAMVSGLLVTSPAVTPPPARILSPGINLIGPAPEGYFLLPGYLWFSPMPVEQALASVSEGPGGVTGYTMVISPNLNQPGWVYAKGMPSQDIVPFHGYWVIMDNPDTLYGFSTTPVG